MGRLWQAAGTVKSVLEPGLLEAAVESGLRSLFVGFETINQASLASQRKHHNVNSDYSAAVKRLHDLGVMINASFVFGLDGDDGSVFDRTVEWAIEHGIETSTFHILTPYPGTRLYDRLLRSGRILTGDWDLYDTRHAVFRPTSMTPDELEEGYWKAYRDFYRWGSIFRAVGAKDTLRGRLRHLGYTAGWKKFEPVWDLAIRTRRVSHALPILESLLDGVHRRRSGTRHSEESADPVVAPRIGWP